MLKRNSKYLILAGLLLVFLQVSAQKKGYKFDKKQKKNVVSYPSPYDFRPGGWLFDLGATGTFSYSTYSAGSGEYRPQFRPGAAVYAGRYYSLRKGAKILRYMDLTLGYKSLWAATKYEAYPDFNPLPGPVSGIYNMVEHYVSANFNLNNTITINRYNFIQNTLGVNAEYRFIEEGKINQPNLRVENPGSFVAQVHYKLGWGIVTDSDKLLILFVEVPVFNIYPKQRVFNQLDFFIAPYQSFVVGVRFMLFKLADTECPKVRSYDKPPNFQNGY